MSGDRELVVHDQLLLVPFDPAAHRAPPAVAAPAWTPTAHPAGAASHRGLAAYGSFLVMLSSLL
ncbi:hypothetical protein [Promicromonospora soli]